MSASSIPTPHFSSLQRDADFRQTSHRVRSWGKIYYSQGEIKEQEGDELKNMELAQKTEDLLKEIIEEESSAKPLSTIWALSIAHMQIGFLYRMMNTLDKAATHLVQAVTILDGLDHDLPRNKGVRKTYASALFRLAEVFQVSGDYHRSLSEYKRSLEIFRSLGDQVAIRVIQQQVPRLTEGFVKQLGDKLLKSLSPNYHRPDSVESPGVPGTDKNSTGVDRQQQTRPSYRADPRGEAVPISIGQEAERLIKRGELKAALAIYDRFLEFHPRATVALNQAGLLNLEIGKQDAASGLFERALDIDPKYVPAWSNLGEAKRMLKDPIGAKEAFETALKYDPENIHAQMGLAYLYMDREIPKRAVELLEQVVRLDAKNTVAWHSLGTARYMLGDLSGAENAYQTALRLDPQDTDSRGGLQKIAATRKSVATAQRTGGMIIRHGTVFSDRNVERICAKCGKRYSEFGRITMSNRALGGALCRSCGKFYCEPCVSEAIHAGTESKPMFCDCGKSKVCLGGSGHVTMDNFEELVVFRAQ